MLWREALKTIKNVTPGERSGMEGSDGEGAILHIFETFPEI